MAQPRRVNLDEQAKVLSCTTPILADHAVTAIKLAAGAVTGSALADGSIDAIKFSAAVFGDGLVYNSLTDAIDVNVVPGELTIVSDQLGIATGGVHTIHLDIDADLTFNNNQILSFRIENLASDPVAGNPGRLIWRTDTKKIRVDDGIAFADLSGGHIIEDEGNPLPQRNELNFVGTGVTVTDVGGKTQVDISGNPVYAKDFVTVSNVITDHSIVLSNTPTVNSEVVSWNGLELKYGASFDYTILGNVITLNAGIILTIGDELQITYAY